MTERCTYYLNSRLTDVWLLTHRAVNQVFSGWGECAVSDDEIGYLTVHFQAAMERQVASKRVLLVCSTGIGTSHLLKSRLLRAFPDWTIVGVVSAGSLHTLQPQDNIELVISTINLPEISLPVVYVSAFLNDTDVRRITEKIVSDKLNRVPVSAVTN